MKKQLLIAGIMMGLTGVYAGAQVSGSPSTQDPNQTAPQSPSQGPGATTPGMQPTFPADQKAPQSPTEQQSGQAPADQTSSSQVQSDLQKAFQGDSALAQSSVSAQVIENKIVLTGTVQSQADKDKAEQIANQVGGSKYTLSNKIEVNGAASSAPSSPDSAPKNPHLSNSFMAQSSSAGQDQSGSASGSTTPGSQSGSADQNAAGSSSSAQESSASSSDPKAQIQSALQQQPTLSGVTVNVTDSSVELSGTVASEKDKKSAKKIATSYAGSRKVVNNITVGSGATQ